MQDIVEFWIAQNLIEGVKDTRDEDGEIIKETTNYNAWLSKPKVAGSNTIKVEIFSNKISFQLILYVSNILIKLRNYSIFY